MIHDIAIIGSGPAGLSLGAQLCAQGFDVVMVSPDYHADWKNNYGVWRDELGDWPADRFSHVWEQPQVKLDGDTLTLNRAYARLDNPALQRAWREQMATATIHQAKATTVHHATHNAAVITGSGEVQARFVVDARGASPRKDHDVAAQTAFGVYLRLDGDPLDGAGMMLMDWRGAGQHDIPSFLYGMRLGDVFFLEETVLAARPPVPIDHLKQRLFMRLEAMGVRVLEVLDDERCFIPLNLPIPSRERTLMFGAAASFVHPATGYSVGRSLSTGRAVADLIEHRWTEDLDTLSEALWKLTWSDRARSTRRFYELGLEVLLKLDPEQTPNFFGEFFKCPDALWRGYMSDTASVGDVAQLMWRVFRNVDFDMKWQLARHASMAALLQGASLHK